MPAAFDTLGSVLRLFGAVLENLRFREDRMREACESEYLGGFTLANLLTLRAGVPWRTAQVVAGRYIVAGRRARAAPLEARRQPARRGAGRGGTHRPNTPPTCWPRR